MNASEYFEMTFWFDSTFDGSMTQPFAQAVETLLAQVQRDGGQTVHHDKPPAAQPVTPTAQRQAELVVIPGTYPTDTLYRVVYCRETAEVAAPSSQRPSQKTPAKRWSLAGLKNLLGSFLA